MKMKHDDIAMYKNEKQANADQQLRTLIKHITMECHFYSDCEPEESLSLKSLSLRLQLP